MGRDYFGLVISIAICQLVMAEKWCSPLSKQWCTFSDNFIWWWQIRNNQENRTAFSVRSKQDVSLVIKTVNTRAKLRILLGTLSKTTFLNTFRGSTTTFFLLLHFYRNFSLIMYFTCFVDNLLHFFLKGFYDKLLLFVSVFLPFLQVTVNNFPPLLTQPNPVMFLHTDWKRFNFGLKLIFFDWAFAFCKV